jgi:hypothetical protein
MIVEQKKVNTISILNSTFTFFLSDSWSNYDNDCHKSQWQQT